MSRNTCTKPVVRNVDNSRIVKVEIVDDSGELFSVTHMPYMTALVFEAMWIRAHADEQRTIRIID